MYYAKVDQYIGQHLDEDEKIQIYKYRLEELIELIMEGKIPDAKTVSMAMFLQEMKNRKKNLKKGKLRGEHNDTETCTISL